MTNSDDIGFDPDELRERYRRERDKRLRTDGIDQYRQAREDLARYVDADPYATTPVDREPVDEDVEVAILGGGFSGLLAAARLSERGVTAFRIVEAGADFGGTWYWNRYPGAQCDTDAYCYLPLLEELGYMPKEKYAYADEIFEHSQRIGRHYGLYERTHFSTRVATMEWDDGIARWHLRTDRGDDIRARFVVSALGPMSRPKLPGVPGLERFAGHSFHTSRWDYAYTGGDTTGGMTRLADQRVAVIGTGASAIQSVPRLARDAAHVYVFQRTPSSVDWRRNQPTDPSWWSSLEPGWQRQRRENFNAISIGRSVDVDLVDDGWTDIFRAISSPKGDNRPTTREERNRIVELTDFQKMEEIRGRVDATVADPTTAELLKPYYRVMCKRPTFNDEYLECFNRPNVTLVDVSDSKGVEQITEHGVIANGHEYEVDLIVYASGFETSPEMRRRTGVDVVGRDGVHYDDVRSRGLKTLHGFCTRGFPNLFSIGISQNAFSVNMTSMFDDQARHIAYILAEAIARGARSVEATEAGQDAWVAQLIPPSTVGDGGFLSSCTPGYYNNEGRSGGGGAFFGGYPRGINAFNQLLEDWRATGEMDGLELIVDASAN
ncbi:MAG: flavin-containing monooxygenase [Ilumatobacteraceae bacterium]